jgi:hypothetical protein
MSWLVGRKEICAYLGGVCWRTVLRRKEKGIPILRAPGQGPVALSEELDSWIIKFNKKAGLDKRFKRRSPPIKRKT